MDLNKLQLFQLVADNQSITLAAKKVLRSQSAVSQQMASLEDELGFQLFKRRKSRIFLSPEGEALLAECLTGVSIVIVIRSLGCVLFEFWSTC